jgi:hypothetical protein
MMRALRSSSLEFRYGAPDVEVRELFTFPERGSRDRAIDLLETAKPETVRRILGVLTPESDER